MVWNDEKDILLCREMLVVEPYQFKEKTKDRGSAWTQISENLNKVTGFNVNIRAVPERFQLLEKKYKKKNSEELKASGINTEESELDVLLEEIINRMKEITFSNTHETKKDEADKELGEEIRLQALETFAETHKRKPKEVDEKASNGKKQHTSGNETMCFLREKMLSDKTL